MSLYRIGDEVIDSSDEAALILALQKAYESKVRPLCLCRLPPVAMYIAKMDDQYILKRMPNTGGEHAPNCGSFEPPAELSGLGEVMGSAIQENADDGMTTLKFDFSLSKGAGRATPAGAGVESDSVRTDGNKLTLRGTLHFLWEEAGFNRWSPAMENKRNWAVIRKYVLQSAQNKVAKGSGISEIIYMPESFKVEWKDEIVQRRTAFFSKAASPDKGAQKFLLAIGEIKEFSPSRYGHKITLKHAPDAPFMLNEDIFKRINKRFEMELGLWDALDNTHLMMIGTFSVGTTGIPSINEIALMIVNENWIPFENLSEYALLNDLASDHRHFLKGLRYNLASSRPLATVVLSDTDPATAMYVIPPGASDEYVETVDELVTSSSLNSWVWHAGLSVKPPFPPSILLAQGMHHESQGIY